VERVDRDVKAKQMRVIEVYEPLRELTFTCADSMERIHKLQVEAERLKKSMQEEWALVFSWFFLFFWMFILIFLYLFLRVILIS
jgi:hypothetical protein